MVACACVTGMAVLLSWMPLYEKTQGDPWVIRVAGRLPAQTESPDDRLIALGAHLMQVCEQPSPLSDHHEQAATARVVVTGRAEMLGEVLDAFREQCDLDLGRTAVLLVAAVGLDQLTLGCGRGGRH